MSTPQETKSNFPLAGLANDGWSTETEATATCYCGAVQLVFPLQAPGLVHTFICNCTDCHKITASMAATNFTILDSSLRHVRGEENLTVFSQSTTPVENHTMANYFCKTCGSLMYRVGSAFEGKSILRVGTVDDFSLHETVLKPRVEQFVECTASWNGGGLGIPQAKGMAGPEHRR